MDDATVFTRYLKRIVFSLSIVLLSTFNAHAGKFGVSAKAGTLGLGIEADYKINNSYNVRFQVNGYDYTDDFEEDGIDYDGEIDLSAAGILLDWRPFKSTFRISAGLYNNGNKILARARDNGNQTYSIGEADYRSASSDPLVIDADIDLGKSSAGYLGIGWGNAAPSGWMFSLELGVLFSGKPEVAINASGSAIVSAHGIEQQFSVSDSSNPLVQELNENIRIEEANVQDELSDFEFYPVIALGIGYRF